MIKECNFKWKLEFGEQEEFCALYSGGDNTCPGEDNCILYQIYKNIDSKTRYHVSVNKKDFEEK